MPNLAVDVDSWARSACYPRSTFYPLSDGVPRRAAGSLEPAFAPARHVRLAVKPASTLALSGRLPTVLSGALRAPPLLFGRRPPQSNYPPGTVRAPSDDGRALGSRHGEGSIPRAPPRGLRPGFAGSCLSSTRRTRCQCQAAVKVHGVFPSFRGEFASSRTVQFRRVHG